VPEAILDTRYNDKGSLEMLVQWRSLPPSENSWVLYTDFRAQNPEFKLEDKLGFEKGGIDHYRYVRQRKNRGGERGTREKEGELNTKEDSEASRGS